MSLKQQIESHVATVFLNSQHFAEEITYWRGVENETFNAIPGSPLSPQQIQGGVTLTKHEMAFQLSVADLGDDIGLPKDGDMIVWEIGGKKYQYKVLATDSTGCFEWLDSLMLVVHTKFQGIQ